MTRLSSLMIISMILAGENLTKKIFDFIFTEDIQGRCNKQPIDNYSKIYSQPTYVYRSLLPLNTPRGDNIGVCNFKRI